MFVGLGLIVVIALFTALIAPYFIDWTAYKEDFEKQASRIIGQKVRVDGEASVRILPLPSISFTELSVGETAAGNTMMTAGRFHANVELMPFLSGEIRVVDMSLIDPVINLEVGEDGKIDWTRRREALVDPDQVKLDKFSIRNAIIRIAGIAEKRTIEGRGISADVSALSLYGPWRIRGTGEIDGENSSFEFSTGRLADDSSIRLRTELQRLDQPYTLSADGTVSLDKGVLSWAGAFNLDPLTSRIELAGFEGREPLPVRVEGDFQLTPASLLLPAYTMRIGPVEDPFSLGGQGQVQLKGGVKFRLEIDGRQVDLNRIARMREGDGASANSLEERINLVRGVLDQIPVPGFSGEIDFEIPAIIAGDTFIREVSALVKPFGDGWEIVRLEADLPGNTLVEARGRLGKGDDFGFHGALLVASRQPSGFAAWAAGKVDPAIRRLSSAGLSANVTLTPSQISLEQMELILDNNQLTGRVQRLKPADENDDKTDVARPAIVAKLQGNQVHLEDLEAIASLFAGEGSLGLQNDFDIALEAEFLSAFELTASNADLQFQYKNGELSIARLNLEDLLGTTISSSGQLTNLLQRPRGNMTLQLVAQDAVSLARHVGERFGWNAPLRALASDRNLSGMTELRVELDSRPGEAGGNSEPDNRLLVEGVVGGTELLVRSTFGGGFADIDRLPQSLSLKAANDNGAILLLQAGLGEFGFSPLPGEMESPLQFALESTGSPDGGHEITVSLNNAETSLSATGRLSDMFGENRDMAFDGTLGASDIAPLASSFGALLPGLNPVLGDVAPFSARFSIKAPAEESALHLTVEKGQLSGNGFETDIRLADTGSGTRQWTGELRVDHVSLGVFADLAGGTSFADGLGDWDDTAFAGRPFAGHNLKISINSATADIGFGKNATGFGANVDVVGNDFAINDAVLNWDGAEVSGGINLATGAESSVANAQILMRDVNAGSVLSAIGLAQIIDGTGSVSVTVDGSGKTPKALIGSLSGSGVVTLDEGRIAGINQDALDVVLAGADEEGFEINAQSVDPLAREAFLAGELRISDVSAPFAISKGRIQFRNIELSGSDGAAPVGELSADLVTGEIETGLRLTPDPGREAVSGGSPDISFSWSGRVGDLNVTTETSALEGFLSIRAFEAEQRRVETLQAAILEKQRFRQEQLASSARGRWLEEKRREEERKAAEEAARIAREAEEKRKREEAERLARQEAERQAKEEEARAAAEAAERERQRARELEALRAAEAEAERRAQEQAEQDRQEKSGIEIKPLPEPETRPGLFENIEKLLFD